MNLEIIQAGRVLRSIFHNGQTYIEAPPTGAYEIRVTNNCPSRRLAVLSVDGVNIIDGKDAGYDGSGYVLNPWQSITVKGWHRTSSEVAAFTFEASGASYAAQTGRGTKNTGVIGLAVFNEKVNPFSIVVPVIHEHHHHTYPVWNTFTTNGGSAVYGSTGGRSACGDSTLGESQVNCSAEAAMPAGATYCAESADFSAGGASKGVMRSGNGQFAKATRSSKSAQSTKGASLIGEDMNLGTGYGQKVTQHTTTTTFARMETPALVLTVHYATTDKLRSWGVPVEQAFVAPVSPNPFPASGGLHVPAPPGWRG